MEKLLNTLSNLTTCRRLLIAVVDLLWEAVVWCPENLQLFVRQGGVYVLLDTMQVCHRWSLVHGVHGLIRCVD